MSHWMDRTAFVVSAQDRTGRAKSEAAPERVNPTPPLPPAPPPLLLLLNASAAHIPVCLHRHWKSVLPGEWNAEV